MVVIGHCNQPKPAVSYDLAVFDPSKAPRSDADFRRWFQQKTVTEWPPGIGFGPPEVFPGPGAKGRSSGQLIVRKLGPLNGAPINPHKLEEWLRARMPEAIRRSDPRSASPL